VRHNKSAKGTGTKLNREGLQAILESLGGLGEAGRLLRKK